MIRRRRGTISRWIGMFCRCQLAAIDSVSRNCELLCRRLNPRLDLVKAELLFTCQVQSLFRWFKWILRCSEQVSRRVAHGLIDVSSKWLTKFTVPQLLTKFKRLSRGLSRSIVAPVVFLSVLIHSRKPAVWLTAWAIIALSLAGYLIRSQISLSSSQVGKQYRIAISREIEHGNLDLANLYQSKLAQLGLEYRAVEMGSHHPLHE